MAASIEEAHLNIGNAIGKKSENMYETIGGAIGATNGNETIGNVIGEKWKRRLVHLHGL